jgi:hypothetical protein
LPQPVGIRLVEEKECERKINNRMDHFRTPSENKTMQIHDIIENERHANFLARKSTIDTLQLIFIVRIKNKFYEENTITCLLLWQEH